MKITASIALSLLSLAGNAAAAPLAKRDVTAEVLPPTNCLNAILQVNTKANAKDYTFTNLVALGKPLLDVVQVLAGLHPDFQNITIFAPTDDAFATFLESVNGTLPDASLIPEILKYHVSPSFVAPADLPAVSGIPTFLGNGTLAPIDNQILLASKLESPPLLLTYGLGNAGVIDTLECTNGVVHVVNSVLFPPNPLMATLRFENLNVLTEALRKASLARFVDRNLTAVTVFAPLDEAFAGVDLSTLTKEELQGVLSYHAVSGRVMSYDLGETQEVETLQGSKVEITVKDGEVLVGGAKVVKANVLTANGVVHIIDKVLTPPATA